jgi:hypothetical protein
MSKTPDLPEPYCVKQNRRRSWCTNVIAAQHGCLFGDREMGYNDAEKSENTGTCYAGNGGAARASAAETVKTLGTFDY